MSETSILIGEVKAWTRKYERLRELLTVELGLADINDIRAAEDRGYRRAIADLRTEEAERVIDDVHSYSCAGARWHQCTDPRPDEVYLTAMATHLEQLATERTTETRG